MNNKIKGFTFGYKNLENLLNLSYVTPGPGTYEEFKPNKYKNIKKKNFDNKFTLSSHKINQLDITIPGPGFYDPKIIKKPTTLLNSTQTFSLRDKRMFKTGNNSNIGPGHYNPIDVKQKIRGLFIFPFYFNKLTSLFFLKKLLKITIFHFLFLTIELNLFFN